MGVQTKFKKQKGGKNQIFLLNWIRILTFTSNIRTILREGVKKGRFTVLCPKLCVGEGPKVPNFLVKITVQSFKKKVIFRTLSQNRGGGGWVRVHVEFCP